MSRAACMHSIFMRVSECARPSGGKAEFLSRLATQGFRLAILRYSRSRLYMSLEFEHLSYHFPLYLGKNFSTKHPRGVGVAYWAVDNKYGSPRS
jgi:hypothetical protein